MRRLSQALTEVLQAEHVDAFVLGDHVPHLRLHLVARHPGAPSQYPTRACTSPSGPRHHEEERTPLPRSMRSCVPPSLAKHESPEGMEMLHC